MVCEALRSHVRCYTYKNKEYSQTLRRLSVFVAIFVVVAGLRTSLYVRGAGERMLVRDRKNIQILQT